MTFEKLIGVSLYKERLDPPVSFFPQQAFFVSIWGKWINICNWILYLSIWIYLTSEQRGPIRSFEQLMPCKVLIPHFFTLNKLIQHLHNTPWEASWGKLHMDASVRRFTNIYVACSPVFLGDQDRDPAPVNEYASASCASYHKLIVCVWRGGVLMTQIEI